MRLLYFLCSFMFLYAHKLIGLAYCAVYRFDEKDQELQYCLRKILRVWAWCYIMDVYCLEQCGYPISPALATAKLEIESRYL